jgi:hypothetical protein
MVYKNNLNFINEIIVTNFQQIADEYSTIIPYKYNNYDDFDNKNNLINSYLNHKASIVDNNFIDYSYYNKILSNNLIELFNGHANNIYLKAISYENYNKNNHFNIINNNIELYFKYIQLIINSIMHKELFYKSSMILELLLDNNELLKNYELKHLILKKYGINWLVLLNKETNILDYYIIDAPDLNETIYDLPNNDNINLLIAEHVYFNIKYLYKTHVNFCAINYDENILIELLTASPFYFNEFIRLFNITPDYINCYTNLFIQKIKYVIDKLEMQIKNKNK